MNQQTTGRKPPDSPLKTLDDICAVLCQSAIQAACRALHAAQVAADMIGRHEGPAGTREAMCALRDDILDAYCGIPEPIRSGFAERRVNLDSDELLELLSLIVRGDAAANATATQTSTTKEP